MTGRHIEHGRGWGETLVLALVLAFSAPVFTPAARFAAVASEPQAGMVVLPITPIAM